jgi:hypothetical protein
MLLKLPIGLRGADAHDLAVLARAHGGQEPRNGVFARGAVEPVVDQRADQLGIGDLHRIGVVTGRDRERVHGGKQRLRGPGKVLGGRDARLRPENLRAMAEVGALVL